MKIIFLDIDGVLNWRKTVERVHVGRFIGIDPAMVARFNQIIDAHPDAKIVISSTWRNSFSYSTEILDFPGLIKYLQARGLKGEVIDHTPLYFTKRSRGHEIGEWLEDEAKKLGVTSFVILDDDVSGMDKYELAPRSSWETEEDFQDRKRIWEEAPNLRPRLVQTYWEKDPTGEGGLQDRHVEAAIELLNKPL